MIKLCDPAIVKSLQFIFKWLKTGIFSNTWTKSNIASVQEKGYKIIVANCRPPSFLPISVKILERILLHSMFASCKLVRNQADWLMWKGNLLLLKVFRHPLLIRLELFFLIFQKSLIKFGMRESFTKLKQSEYWAPWQILFLNKYF